MSDVIVTTTNSVTDVTTTDDVTNINITETVVEVSASTAGVQGVPGVNSDPIYVIVTNKTGVTLSKGAIVYTSGANGTHTQVSLANASSDATSARTLGWVVSDILNNADGLVCVEGYIDGINTQGVTEGAQLYLSGTVSGGFTETKPQAPTHLVYVGICSKASAGNGRVYVKVQNGYELDELHNVKIVSPQNKDLLQYVSGTALWENVAATAVSVGSATNAGTAVFATTASSATNAATAITISGSITKSQVSDFTSGTVASASTAQQAGTAVYSVSSGSALVAGTADSLTGSITRSQVSDFSSGTVTTITGDITRSQVSDFASGTVTSASTAQTSGTAFYSTSSGSALVAGTADTISGSITKSQVSDFTSGTVTTISGTITRSQVSDYASGTVANISGTVSQSQVSNLVTDLAGKAGLSANNTFSGLNTFSNFTTFQAAADTIPIRIFGASGQSADLFSVNDYLTNTQFEILSDGRAQSLKGIIATVSSTASVPLVVRGTAGQSANLTEIQDSTGGTPLAVSSTYGWVGRNAGTVSFALSSQNGLGAFYLQNASQVGLLVRGAASQTANLQEWQSSTGSTAAFVDPSGRGVFPTVLAGSFTTAQGAHIALQTTATTNKGLLIKGIASQSANLFEIQDSTGATAVQVNSSGSLVYGFASGSLLSANGRILAVASTATVVPATFKGATSQTANLTEWQNDTGGTVAYVSSSGFININNASLRVNTGGATYGARINVATDGVGVIGQVIRATASQSADLQQWQNSSGGTVARVDKNGAVSAQYFGPSGAGLLGYVDWTTNSPIFNTGGTAVIGITVRGVASQSADLQQWQNSGGTVRARVGSNGDIKANNVSSINSFMQITENAGGALQVWARATAAAGNPGTNFAYMYFRDGTNAGTLKLVVRAGTAGAETTILDNIPQS